MLEVDTGFASRRVTRVLDEIVSRRGRPQAIRCDNGPELTSRHFLAWALDWKIELRHIQPGKPTQNAHVESFHGRLREECLRVSWFTNLFDARRKVSDWKVEYNEQRPHSSLGYKTPAEFARAALTQSCGLNLLDHLYGDRGQVSCRSADGKIFDTICLLLVHLSRNMEVLFRYHLLLTHDGYAANLIE